MLELKDLEFSVPGTGDRSGTTIDIIKGVNMTVGDDRFVVITGPNGGGKSTLAKLIMGVEQPTGGQIVFDGHDITSLPIDERAKLGIGFAFQQPARFKGMTVKKLLAIAAKQKGSCLECNAYLSKVGLCSKDYLNREVDKSLSGGELKRIEIATILARDPLLSIYDEPEAGIDLWSFNMLVDTFKNMLRPGGPSVIIISHQERIMELADELTVIADGRVRETGPRDEILPRLMGELTDFCSFGRQTMTEGRRYGQ